MKYSLITILNSEGTVSYCVACPYEKRVGEKRCFAPKGTRIKNTLPTMRTTPVYFIQKFSTSALRGKGELIGSFNENCDFRAYAQRIRRPLGGVNLAHNHLRPLKRRRWISKNPYLELPYRVVIDEILRHMEVKILIISSIDGMENLLLSTWGVGMGKLPKALFTLYGFFKRDETKRVFFLFKVDVNVKGTNVDSIFKYRNIVTDYKYERFSESSYKHLNLKIGSEYKYLRTIDISGGELKAFSIKDNRSYTRIKKISLKHNYLESVDTTGIKWPIDLILIRNGIKDLDVLKLGPLNVLKVENNQVQYFDQRKPGISKLKELHLFGNELKEIDFSGLTELEVLDLSFNHFDKVSFSKRKYGSSKLKRLNLSENKLNEIDFSGLTELEELNLSYNHFDKVSFPKWKYESSKLKILNLNGNRLSDGDFSGLPNLEELYLSNNHFDKVSFPKWKYESSKLKTLNLNGNRLSDGDFSGLPKLEELYLSINHFRIFPTSLEHVNDSLVTLQLNHNPLTKYQKIKSVMRLMVSGTPLKQLDLDNTKSTLFINNDLPKLLSFKSSGYMRIFSKNKIPLIGNLELPRSLTVFDNNVLDSVTYLDLSKTRMVDFSRNTLKNLTVLRLPRTIKKFSSNNLNSIGKILLECEGHVNFLRNTMNGLKSLSIRAGSMTMNRNMMPRLNILNLVIPEPGDEIQKLIRRIKGNELKSLEVFTVNRKYYTIKDNKLFFEGEEVDEREERLVGRRRVKARKRSD